MIDKLLEEMFTECHACQGSGVFLDEIDSDRACPLCGGDGYGLTYEGYRLQQAILKGEKV